MKRYIAILSTLFFVSLFVGVASCTKKQPPETLFSRLQGQWKKTQYATDDNNNGRIDAQEIHPQSSVIIDELVFNGDSTGYEKTVINNNQSSESVLNFKWYPFDADSVALVYTAHFSITYYVADISSVNLNLYTNTSTGLAAYFYNK